MTIDAFTGQYRFLSNFYPAPATYDRVTYPTAEHAYQAAKTVCWPTRNQILLCRTPAAAKRLGRTVHLRPGWQKIRVQVMTAIVRDKFSRPEMRHLLMATGEAELIEGNDWGDTFWGVCGGRGQNKLGEILMSLREEWR